MTAERRERHSLAAGVIMNQHLFHPLIRKLLLKRVDGELRHEPRENSKGIDVLKDAIQKTGLSSPLRRAIEHFEADFNGATTDYGFKSSVSHLRSFLEFLCREVVARVQATSGIPFTGEVSRPADVRRYLADKNVGFLTEGEVKLLASVYGYISDKAVHSLSTRRDEAIISRNLALEISTLLIRRLEQVVER